MRESESDFRMKRVRESESECFVGALSAACGRAQLCMGTFDPSEKVRESEPRCQTLSNLKY